MSLYTCTWYLTIATVTNYLQSCVYMYMCMYTCNVFLRHVCPYLLNFIDFIRAIRRRSMKKKEMREWHLCNK